MRFRFPDDKNANERAEREAVLRRIDAWWAAFAREAPRIDAHFSEGNDFDVPAFIEAHLEEIDRRLMWEFGPALRGGGHRHRFVITPESDVFLRPLVDAIVARAPGNTGFEFHACRPAVSLEAATAMVKGRAAVSIEGWTVHVAPTEDYGVDLTFVAPLAVATLQAAPHAALVAAESLLGEVVVDTSVDGVEVTASIPGETVPLDRLAEKVSAVLERLRSELPTQALLESTEDRKGAVLELEPTEQVDYAAQEDMYVAVTTNLGPTQRWLSGRPFSSQRFSRAGETFCYLKIDGTNGLDPAGFGDRGDIEDALDEALIEAKLGATFGGGTGFRYSYVELSLRDVEQAVPVIREVLRSGRIPKRTWLLFHDSSFQSEWVGIWDDSPPPPKRLLDS